MRDPEFERVGQLGGVDGQLEGREVVDVADVDGLLLLVAPELVEVDGGVGFLLLDPGCEVFVETLLRRVFVRIYLLDLLLENVE